MSGDEDSPTPDESGEGEYYEIEIAGVVHRVPKAEVKEQASQILADKGEDRTADALRRAFEGAEPFETGPAEAIDPKHEFD